MDHPKRLIQHGSCAPVITGHEVETKATCFWKPASGLTRLLKRNCDPKYNEAVARWTVGPVLPSRIRTDLRQRVRRRLHWASIERLDGDADLKSERDE